MKECENLINALYNSSYNCLNIGLVCVKIALLSIALSACQPKASDIEISNLEAPCDFGEALEVIMDELIEISVDAMKNTMAYQNEILKLHDWESRQNFIIQSTKSKEVDNFRKGQEETEKRTKEISIKMQEVIMAMQGKVSEEEYLEMENCVNKKKFRLKLIKLKMYSVLWSY